MRRVIIESPYAGDRARNHAYLLDCLRDCYARGEAPIASHLIGPLVLDDNDPMQRRLGIMAGHAWMRLGGVDAVVVYKDLGLSAGMKEAVEAAARSFLPIEYRQLQGKWAQPRGVPK